MSRSRAPSEQTTAVLLLLARQPSVWQHGYDLCQQTGIKAGSMYPILIRLADRGLLETAWEEAAGQGRPPRHLYRLTGAGLRLVADLSNTVPAQGALGSRLRAGLAGAG